MAKLIDRDPTQEMIDAGREALNLAKRISADEIPLVFSYMYDAAPEIQKNPVAWMIDDDGDVEYNGVDRFSCGRTGGVPLYTFPPDAQAEIVERIKELEKERAEYMGYSHVDNYIKRQATRIAELERDLSNASARDCRRNQLINEIEQALGDYEGSPADRIHQQAAEISRLKALVGKCEEAILAIRKAEEMDSGLLRLSGYNRCSEALAAIKEEGL